MRRTIALAALLAMVPAMIGAPPAQAKGLSVALCSGGTVTIPAAPPRGPADQQSPCCAKACHSGCSRKRFDRSQ
ncbi:hypothetical protein B2G71_05835 [Novosphingobium sp. PC22D]|uniref:hypothetical protein n=1 Tax=Novosphingobium sp. PC22D TaxID=1962403 RepID=UPI000BF04476|nr:hypothetical protein [Novosphingobium sp. PC22D]PEQ13829.1 hypothetical protein B2G71_05835 [Novosphingobium sp. PC22D]